MSTLKIKRENGKIFCPLADSWHIETPEEKVRQEYIKILVEDYGYSLDQMAQEIKVNNSQRGQGKARADIVIWKSKQDKIESKAAFIVVECKAENVRIREEDYYQGYNYASWAGASFFVTTNEKETKYFNVDKDYLPKELVEVVAIPTAEEALNDKKVKDILSKTKTFTRDDFTKILRTCHNIIRNNDKLSPEAAFDEISKILFMKIKYEREQRGAKVFTKNEFEEKEKWFEKEIRPSLKGTPKDLPYMQFLFYNTKEEFKDDQLFEENEIIKIRQNSFEQILEKLETYNLSDTQDDVKGIAFEQFLGTTFRGELGQYFTPRTIVDFMTHILDPKENETVCDPTCGSGGFLIKAFEYMREKIEEDVKKAKSELRSVIEGENYDSLSEREQVVINERIEAMQSTLNKELDTQVEGSRMYNLSRNCIYGTDANPRMARTSKMNMIMHGDGHGGVHHHDGLLNVNGIFEERFDVILTNPPFGARIDKSQKITEADKFTDEALIAKYKEKYGEAYANPQEYVIFNKTTILCYGYLDIPDMPKYNYQYTGKKYAEVCAIAKKIAAELKKAGADDYDLLAVDYFMWDEILPLAEKKSPVSPATPEVKKPVTVKDSKSLHDEIEEKLVAIGELLGFDSRSEVKIATGAVVDAVWEAKIGNMGKAIYVFEVQSKGSIDSLILNLKKAQSNAAVQAVVAVADEEQLAKIIQESAGVIDEKSLRTWDSEDVLAVYDALVRAHESINKLALVPESF